MYRVKLVKQIPNINSKKSTLYYLLCFLLFFTFFGCNQAKKESNIFRYNQESGIATLDPAFAKSQSVMWAVHQLYNTLVETNDRLGIVPSLAKSWEISNDNLTFVFHLRTDVFFHDNPLFPKGKGRKMTAHDVAYSFGRIIDKSTASSGAWIFNDRVDKNEPFIALDDSTFQLKLSSPFQPILGVLSMQYCSIVPKEIVEHYGKDFGRHPCGSGPFQFVTWEEGQALIMKKNPDYFEKDSVGISLPYLDGIYVTFIENKATEFLLFQQKKLDFMNDIDASFKDEILSKKGELRPYWNDKIKMIKHPYLAIEYLGILQDTSNVLLKNSPLRDVRIRQAINYGFDRRKMMMYLRNSIGLPAENGFVPAGLPSFDTSVKGFTYQPDKAMKLLADAGFPNGKGLKPITLLTVPIYGDVASFIANELQQIGIKINVEIVQKSILLSQTAKSEALFFRGSWIADYPDAENFLSVFYSKNPAPPNYTRYSNPQFDILYKKSLHEKNDSLRWRLNREADQLMIQTAPVVPLWYEMVIQFVQPEIENFHANSLNLLELRRVRKLK